MILLDTDHATFLLQENSQPGARLAARLAASGEEVSISIVAAEEVLRGWLAVIARQPLVVRQIDLYAKLSNALRFFQTITLTPFDQPAADHFAALARVRIGTMDKKIAAIALARSALLLTSNARDFEQVPGLTFADWAAETPFP